MKTLKQYWTFVVAGLLALGVGAWLGTARQEQSTGISVDALWNAQFIDLNGKPVLMASMKGRPVIVNFWATWCGPCKEEMPDFQRLAQSEVANSTKIVGIGIDNAANMRAFAQQLGITYMLLEGGPEALDLLKTLGNKVGGLPYTLLIDANGKVAMQRLGRVSFEELTKAATAGAR